jgi:hypothetical protein
VAGGTRFHLRFVATTGEACDLADLPAQPVAGSWIWAPDGHAVAFLVHSQTTALVTLDLTIGELQATSVGLVGFGAIGQAVAQRLTDFGAQVAYTIRHRVDEATETRLNASSLRLDELLRGSQILSLQLPLSESTRHLIGTAELEALPVGAGDRQHVTRWADRRGRATPGARKRPPVGHLSGRGIIATDGVSV